MDAPYQIPITPEDDEWHSGYSNHWFETETHWWSWNVPERNLGGWLHHAQRVNQGTMTGGLWIWDDSPAGALYEVRRTVPYQRSSIRNGGPHDFGTGHVLEILEPLKTYRTTWSDPEGGCEADLLHEAIMAPHSHPEGAPPLYNNRHLDQCMKVTGTIVLHGETIDVDCYSVRDRSWGPRPSGAVPLEGRLPDGTKPTWRRGRTLKGAGIGYVFGTEGPDDLFMAFSAPRFDESGKAVDDVTAGYLIRDGVYAPIVSGFRTTKLAPETRFITEIRLDATDALDREIVAEGVLRSHHGTEGPSGTGMFHWTWTGGHSGYGEDQSGGLPEVLEALGGATA